MAQKHLLVGIRRSSAMGASSTATSKSITALFTLSDVETLEIRQVGSSRSESGGYSLHEIPFSEVR